jgi:hypothetical protein
VNATANNPGDNVTSTDLVPVHHGAIADIRDIPPVDLPPLSDEDRERLHEIEATFVGFKEKVVEFSAALKEVRDTYLYRETHGSFGEYVQDRLGISRASAYRFIDSSGLRNELRGELSARGIEVAPTKARTIGMLKQLDDLEDQVAVWEEAVSRSDGREPTDAVVKAVIAEFRDPETQVPLDGPTNGHVADSPRASVVDEADEDDDEEAPVKEKSGGEAPPERFTQEDKRPDEEWLAELKLTKKLKGAPLKSFIAEALLWRRVFTQSKQFHGFKNYYVPVTKDIFKQGTIRGPLYSVIDRFLRAAHPNKYVICPIETGGCGGLGNKASTGNCEKCLNRGYLTPDAVKQA